MLHDASVEKSGINLYPTIKYPLGKRQLQNVQCFLWGDKIL